MRAQAKWRLGDKKGAVDDAGLAIKANPREPDPYTLRSQFRNAAGEKEGALEDATKVTQVAPRDVASWRWRASLRWQQKDAPGAIEDLASPRIGLLVSGELKVAEVERVFHSELGFDGDASLRARVEIPPAGGFRITGTMTAPQVRTNQFTFDNVVASVATRPEALVARIDRADYAGGRANGVLRIANLTSKPQPMTLAIEGGGLSMERFFGDIGLKGTGLSGTGAISLALRLGEAGIDVARKRCGV